MSAYDLLFHQFQKGFGRLGEEQRAKNVVAFNALLPLVRPIWDSFGHKSSVDNSHRFFFDATAFIFYALDNRGRSVGIAALHVDPFSTDERPALIIQQYVNQEFVTPKRVPIWFLFPEERVVGRPLNVDGVIAKDGDRLLRDLSKPGQPIIYCDPIEEILAAIVELTMT